MAQAGLGATCLDPTGELPDPVIGQRGWYGGIGPRRRGRKSTTTGVIRWARLLTLLRIGGAWGLEGAPTPADTAEGVVL